MNKPRSCALMSRSRQGFLLFLLLLAGWPQRGLAQKTTPNLSISGSVSWQSSSTQVDIRVGKITNPNTGGNTGSLRLRLWATAQSFPSPGYVLGTRNLDGLPGGYSYNNVTGSVAYTPPPDGTYYTTIALEEYVNASVGWVTATSADTGRVKFGNAPPPPPTVQACDQNATASGGPDEDVRIWQMGRTSGEFTLSYDMLNIPDRLDVYYEGKLIHGTGLVAGARSLNLNFGPGQAKELMVIVNNGGSSDSDTAWSYSISCKVTATPANVTSPATAGGTVGQAFSYQISANNQPVRFAATGLPAGLSLNASTGVISGTPTAAGTSSVTLQATGTSGSLAAGPLTLTIVNASAEKAALVLTDANDNSTVAENATAWITGEAPPRMPHLTARLTNPAAGVSAHWSFVVNYIRPALPYADEDKVSFPANGTIDLPANAPWDLGALYQGKDFFGGDAQVTCRVDGQPVALVRNFKILGKNPTKATVKTALQDPAFGAPFYLFAMAKLESNSRSAEEPFMKHFNQTGTRANLPNWGQDPSGPGGYGIFQITRATAYPPPIPRKLLWNWQENAKAAMAVLAEKRGLARTALAQERTKAAGVPIPAISFPRADVDKTTEEVSPVGNLHLVGGDAAHGGVPATARVTFVDQEVTPVGSKPTILEAETIKRYNSRTFCTWHPEDKTLENPTGQWEFDRQRGFDSRSYLDLVSAELESGPNAVSVAGTASRGGFVLSRNGSLDAALIVSYHNGGSAVRNVDYQALPGSATLAAGQAEVVIPVRLLPGANRAKKVKIILDPSPNGAYSLGKTQSKVFLSDLP